jgi:hypothetical protein
MPVASATAEPAGGAGRVHRVVEGIARRAIDGVAAVRAQAEFRHVGLAEHHAAGGAQVRHHVLVARGHVVAKERAAPGRAQALGFLQVLDAERQAGERAQRLAAICAASMPRAVACAASTSIATMALTAGFTASIRATQEASSSEGERRFGADQAARFQRRQVAGLGHRLNIPVRSHPCAGRCPRSGSRARGR